MNKSGIINWAEDVIPEISNFLNYLKEQRGKVKRKNITGRIKKAIIRKEKKIRKKSTRILLGLFYNNNPIAGELLAEITLKLI